MIPILFSPYDGLNNHFTTNGIGRLSACSRCEVTESDENEYDLEMEYPMTGPHFDDIRTGYFIGAIPFQNGTMQGFEVYKISKPVNGLSTIYARHVSRRLKDTPVNRFSADNIQKAFSQITANSLEACPFTFTTEFNNNVSFVSNLPMSIWALLTDDKNGIQSRYGGEYEWDNYKVIHHKQRGSNKGAVIKYGKNLIDLTQETNIENTITGVHVYWNQNETFTSIDSPVQSEHADNFPYHKTSVIDVSREFNDIPTKAQMIEWCKKYIKDNNVGIPTVSITVSFADLNNVFEYQGVSTVPSINLGDTVTVYFERLGIETEARVNKTVWNVLLDAYSSIDVGERKKTFTDQLVETSILADAAVTETGMAKSIDRATGVLNAGQRGHVIVNRNSEGWSNEILFMDDQNLSKAKYILRANMNGLGFTDNGINGPYWQSWTIDGHMTLGGLDNHYGDFKILDERARPTVHMDKYGLRLWHVEAIGYLDNGVMFEDQEKTTRIEPRKGSCYYDPATRDFYIWDGSKYKTPEGYEGLNARMVNDGLGIYNGEIDLKWNGKRGLYVGKDTVEIEGEETEVDAIYLGDFMINEEYDRQILESSDEMTGMSGDPGTSGGWLLWAGWHQDEPTTFYVDNSGDVVINGGLKINGGLWINGHPVSSSGGGSGSDDDWPSDDPGEDSGGTGPGYQGGDSGGSSGGSSFDDLVDYYGDN